MTVENAAIEGESVQKESESHSEQHRAIKMFEDFDMSSKMGDHEPFVILQDSDKYTAK